MDLEELKNRWQTESDKNINLNKKSMEQLELLLKEKTSRTLLGIKERYRGLISYLMIGLLFNIIISPFLHYFLGDEGPVFRLTFGGLLSLAVILTTGLIVLFFYWIKYTNLKTDLTQLDVRTALNDHLAKQKKSLRQEVFLILAIFASLFVVARLSSQYLGHGDFQDIFRKDILSALGIGLLIMGFYIFKRWQMYSRNIKQLRGYLNELTEHD